ncbi:hypothetical protein POPTR_008G059301v4 [Populus trichocarpa]|uniref:Uncharacterized protein n=1 Tax=Populus trichocarpa TaxID=3694 RepID=A0ACC0SK37_POPTR|nr:hypothetical protein POPTR_008G059301v4 [Populus trichocarpa]
MMKDVLACMNAGLCLHFICFQFYDTSSKATELGICPFTGQSEEIRSYFRLRIPLSSQKTLRELLVLETW